MNELEARLRTWTPRRPSQKLELAWRSATNRNSTLPGADWAGPSWSTLARAVTPALAGLVVTVALLTQPEEGLVVPHARQPALIALALSNQNFAPYLPGSVQSRANRLDTFGWTNGNGSLSSMRSLTPPEAIDLQ